MRSGSAFKDTDSATLFRMLLATAVDGILVIDERGELLIYNDACEKLFGYTPQEVIGQNIRMLMPEPYRHEHDGYLKAYRDTGEKKIIGIGREVKALRKDGSEFPVYLSVGEGQLDERRVFVGIVHDITVRREATRRLQETQAELVHMSRFNEMGQMTSSLAHELNQPLAAIMNYLSAAGRTLAKLDAPEAARARDLMQKASDQSARAGQIIRHLRDFVEKRDHNRREENLNLLVEEAVEFALLGSDDLDVHVDIELEDGLPAVFADRIQIQQVILNLARNAVEAMQDCPLRRLSVTTSHLDDGFIRTSIADTGPGLASEVAENLFQPFITTKEKGMGIGLSICWSIVDAHGGELWAEKNEAGGTSFHFRLPSTPD
ncbi:PAS domain-containing sensor histidine kinase [Parvibaculum sp.]|uniref:PAS domain-containing sensor histidine kinase n=1 Tax=Parvibaculum sp. TaxID=2024848 RepID=UPI000C90C248|nr:PAS domain-containing sensor histidine kinase [Parvibaculum sp.]MAB14812.1 PAS domain-containing sensor histidine kinase [Parvibaculum sp.]